MEVLLIGGTNGRRWVNISDGDTFIDAPKLRTGFQTAVGGDLGSERYVRQEVAGANGKTRSFFVIEGGDVIDLLFEFYRG
ncbi:hypothetical protein [Pseudomonas asplenii]|uniref:hypothetical protein n=1 Tax=Pseudomonas asplenii TaxID=53407 RepID=UPI0006B5EB98|nr:hypothetical protein [Pseudomonas fuscovaginae]